MFKADVDTIELTAQSGNKYSFKMCEFDTMESIDRAVEKFAHPGLYVFAYRYSKPNDARYWYNLKYIGETEDFSKRDYNNHHKKSEIEGENANSWGYCITTIDAASRKELEEDLIKVYNPPCNG